MYRLEDIEKNESHQVEFLNVWALLHLTLINVKNLLETHL